MHGVGRMENYYDHGMMGCQAYGNDPWNDCSIASRMLKASANESLSRMLCPIIVVCGDCEC